MSFSILGEEGESIHATRRVYRRDWHGRQTTKHMGGCPFEAVLQQYGKNADLRSTYVLVSEAKPIRFSVGNVSMRS
ncbi:Uncharacterized protein TCM_015121 [Theobroma cacao]|uniref:Uncharacterized protein n=1 Tax=Theobroma cacao TaxID=3641 RepID=A0A061FZZ7_THECC|nr:Uncharacterized protein TCM_015121 [Theobroma cacao]